MPRTSKPLTRNKVRNLPSGKYADGNGLYLIVDDSGARRWVLRVTVPNMSTKGGKPKRMEVGLGGAAYVDLDEARAKALEYRKLAKRGLNPLQADGRSIPSFEQFSRSVYEQNKDSWKNPKHRQQWINTLETYVFHEIGAKRIDHIEQSDVLRCIQPIWTVKNETARRVIQRIGKVLDIARASGFRSDENPVTVIRAGNVLPKIVNTNRHHNALDWRKVPEFWNVLVNIEVPSSLALQFLILTASRTSEVLNAKWDEIDLENKTWTISAERMKANRSHVVPLSEFVLDFLNELKKTKRCDFIFEGQRSNHPLSNMAMAVLLRRMGRSEITIHGFRSSFRDWCGDNGVDRTVAELSLAHRIGNEVELAYARSDMLERRRIVMQNWGNFVTGIEASNVTEIQRQV